MIKKTLNQDQLNLSPGALPDTFYLGTCPGKHALCPPVKFQMKFHIESIFHHSL